MRFNWHYQWQYLRVAICIPRETHRKILLFLLPPEVWSPLLCFSLSLHILCSPRGGYMCQQFGACPSTPPPLNLHTCTYIHTYTIHTHTRIYLFLPKWACPICTILWPFLFIKYLSLFILVVRSQHHSFNSCKICSSYLAIPLMLDI